MGMPISDFLHGTVVFTTEDRFPEVKDIVVTCRCGEKMVPSVMSNLVDFSCPKVRLWNFWNHSMNRGFIRMHI